MCSTVEINEQLSLQLFLITRHCDLLPDTCQQEMKQTPFELNQGFECKFQGGISSNIHYLFYYRILPH